ncbi:MAG: mechanosensitive ion channel family protein [Saprospiraceae bacterium]
MDFNFNVDSILEAALLYLPKVLGAILVVIIGFWLAGKISKIVGKTLTNRGTDATVIPFLTSLISVGIKVIVLISAAGMFGVETTSFVAMLGALTFAVGLALQGSLGHFASGVLLLTFKPYQVGDLVTIGGGQTGHVQGIQIFNTILLTLDNHKVVVPNGTVTSNVITNISGQETVGVPLNFNIGYDQDIEAAKTAILKAADSCPYMLKDPKPAVFVSGHGESALELATRPFCKSEHYWDAFFYMQENVKKEFDAAGIKAPMTKREVHMIPTAS